MNSWGLSTVGLVHMKRYASRDISIWRLVPRGVLGLALSGVAQPRVTG